MNLFGIWKQKEISVIHYIRQGASNRYTKKGEPIKLLTGKQFQTMEHPKTNLGFIVWADLKCGDAYKPNQSYRLFKTTTLYAWYEDSDTHVFLAGLGSVKTKLSAGWEYRIDPENSNFKLQRHIHIEKDDLNYAQNNDGTVHDKKKSSGTPPKSVRKELKEKGIWDWDKKHQQMLGRTKKETTYINDSPLFYIKYTFADGKIYYYCRDNEFKLVPSVTLDFLEKYYNLASYDAKPPVVKYSKAHGRYIFCLPNGQLPPVPSLNMKVVPRPVPVP